MANVKSQFTIITVALAGAVASCVRFEKSIFKASTDPDLPTSIHTHTHTYLYTHTHTHTSTSIHTHTHTHTPLYTHTPTPYDLKLDSHNIIPAVNKEKGTKVRDRKKKMSKIYSKQN
jgi:hypothetical protein